MDFRNSRNGTIHARRRQEEIDRDLWYQSCMERLTAGRLQVAEFIECVLGSFKLDDKDMRFVWILY